MRYSETLLRFLAAFLALTSFSEQSLFAAECGFRVGGVLSPVNTVGMRDEDVEDIYFAIFDVNRIG